MNICNQQHNDNYYCSPAHVILHHQQTIASSLYHNTSLSKGSKHDFESIITMSERNKYKLLLEAVSKQLIDTSIVELLHSMTHTNPLTRPTIDNCIRIIQLALCKQLNK
jgi:hypothetical protein